MRCVLVGIRCARFYSRGTHPTEADVPDPILVAKHGDIECFLLPELVNRHGLITGATGTGKTITLQTIAESLSRIGVPVFMADVKGDLTGITQSGTVAPKM